MTTPDSTKTTAPVLNLVMERSQRSQAILTGSTLVFGVLWLVTLALHAFFAVIPVFGWAMWFAFTFGIIRLVSMAVMSIIDHHHVNGTLLPLEIEAIKHRQVTEALTQLQALKAMVETAHAGPQAVSTGAGLSGRKAH